MTNETHDFDAARRPAVPSGAGTSREVHRLPVAETRGVRFLPWLLTGGLLGLAGGVWLALSTDMDPRYTVNTQVAFFGALGAALGVMVLGGIAAVLDWWLLRRR